MDIQHLRNNPAFPGGLVNILEEFDARIKALEAHASMLADMQPEYQQHLERQAAIPTDQPGAQLPPEGEPQA